MDNAILEEDEVETMGQIVLHGLEKKDEDGQVPLSAIHATS